MHQGVNFGSDESIVDEKIFVDAERRVTAFEVADAIVGDSVAQCQILRARRSADRISLDEAELLQSALERRRPEKAASSCMASQVVEGDASVQVDSDECARPHHRCTADALLSRRGRLKT